MWCGDIDCNMIYPIPGVLCPLSHKAPYMIKMEIDSPHPKKKAGSGTVCLVCHCLLYLSTCRF